MKIVIIDVQSHKFVNGDFFVEGGKFIFQSSKKIGKDIIFNYSGFRFRSESVGLGALGEIFSYELKTISKSFSSNRLLKK